MNPVKRRPTADPRTPASPLGGNARTPLAADVYNFNACDLQAQLAQSSFEVMHLGRTKLARRFEDQALYPHAFRNGCDNFPHSV